LLPALLGVLRDRVDAGRLPTSAGARGTQTEGRSGERSSIESFAIPLVSLAISVAALIALALPAIGLGWHVGRGTHR
jgi:uncharacterized membrane protein YdfJ with MMPL/SSD domain